MTPEVMAETRPDRLLSAAPHDMLVGVFREVALRGVLGVGAALALVVGGAQAAPESDWIAKPSAAEEAAAVAGLRDRAAGGRAVMRCAVQPDGALGGCRVIAESPQGAGYGQALLTLAPKYRRQPPGQAGLREVTIANGWYQVDTPPDWLKRPTSADIMEVFPRAAVNKGVDGSAKMSCVITVEGAAEDCFAIEETPPGLGFGQAAIALAPQLRFKPARRNGVPVASTLVIPLSWRGVRTVAEQKPGRRLLPPNLPWAAAPTLADVAAAYPEKARAERRGGKAVVFCEISEDGGLVNCRDLPAEPGGYGFGAAARGLAEGFRLPITSEADRKATRQLIINLPVVFDPAMLEAAPVTVAKPTLAARPTAADLTQAFGERPARVELDCRVASGGGLEDCRVLGEQPAGAGAAALPLAAKVRVTAWTVDGMPTVGGRVQVPLSHSPALK